MAAPAAVVLRRQAARRAEGKNEDGVEVGGEAGPDLLTPTDSRPGDILMSSRLVLDDLNSLEGVKGTILFACFFVFYLGVNSWRFDAVTAGQSITWISEAVADQYDFVDDGTNPLCRDPGVDCFTVFSERTTIDELQEFLDRDVTNIISAVSSYCPGCEMAMTPLPFDIEDLPMDEYVCTDFERDGPGFAGRDCEAVDAEWREAPTREKPPCCRDPSLRKASLALQIMANASGRSLSALEEVGAEATRAFLERALDSTGTIMQVVIKRGDSLFGALFKAEWKSRQWLPGRVETCMRYWAYRFDRTAVGPVLVGLSVVFWAFSLFHEGVQVYMAGDTRRERLKAITSPYMLLVEIPGILLPFVTEIFRARINLSDFVLVVTLVQLLLFVRLFEECGRVIPGAFGLVLKTLEAAARDLGSLTLVLGCTILVLAKLYMDLFAVVDPSFATFPSAVARMFTVVVEGNPLDGPALELSPAAWIVMHVVTNVFIFLILAQVCIAILVGAFDTTREAERHRKRSREIDKRLVQANQAPVSFAQRLRSAADFALFYRTFGEYIWRVHLGVQRVAEGSEYVCVLPGGGEEKRDVVSLDDVDDDLVEVMITEPMLARALGPDVARLIRERYGVRLKESGAQDEGKLTLALPVAVSRLWKGRLQTTAGKFSVKA